LTREIPEMEEPEEDFILALTDFHNKRMSDVHTILPGRIISYEGHTTRKAQVEVSVRLPNNQGEFIEVKPIDNVPIVFPSTSTTSVLLPIVKGDGVLLMFSELGIGNFLNGSVTVDADNFNKFNLTDCIAIPGLFSDPTMPEIAVEVNEEAYTIVQGENFIQISTDDILVQRKEDKIHMTEDSILLEKGDMSVALLPGGQITINGVSEELIALLSEFLQTLSSSTVITGIGPQPFTPDAIANFTALKTRLDTLKG
jgi:hypothetical protein